MLVFWPQTSSLHTVTNKFLLFINYTVCGFCNSSTEGLRNSLSWWPTAGQWLTDVTNKRPAHWSQGGSFHTAMMLQSSPRASLHQLRPRPCLAPSSALFSFSLYLFPESISLINHRHLNFHFRLFFEGTPGASLVAQLVKNSSAMWETWVRFLGWEDPLEKGMVTMPVF